LENAPVWRYIAKDGLKSPRVEAVEEFRKAVEESEKAAAQKQQQESLGPGPLSPGERESTGSRVRQRFLSSGDMPLSRIPL
jgi:hypothetical protein